MNFGSIFSRSNLTAATNAAKGFASSNLSGAVSGIMNGASTLAKASIDGFSNVLNDKYGFSLDSIYDSSYALGNEWVPDPAYTATFMFTDPNTKTAAWVGGYIPETISLGFGAEFSSPFENAMSSLTDNAIAATARLSGYKVSANLFSMLLWNGSSHIDMTLEMRFVALRDTYEEIIKPMRQLSSLITPTIDAFSATPGPLQLGIINAPGPTLDLSGLVSGSAMDGASSVATTAGGVTKGIVNGVSSAINNVTSGQQNVVQATVSMAGATLESLGAGANELAKNAKVKNNISLMLGTFCYLRSIVVKDVSQAYNIKCDEDGNWTDVTVSVQISTFVTPTNIDLPDIIGYGQGGGADTKDPTSTGLFEIPESLKGVAEKASSAVNKAAASIGVKLDSATVAQQLGKKVQVAAQTKVTALSNELAMDLSKLGKDAGLSSKVTETGTFKLGMSSADQVNFNNILMG